MQFGQQEPGSHAEIQAFVDENYPAAAQLPLMAKIEVNGPGQHPIYAWLQTHAPAAPGTWQPPWQRLGCERSVLRVTLMPAAVRHPHCLPAGTHMLAT